MPVTFGAHNPYRNLIMKNILTALSVAFVCAACSTPVDFTEYGKGEPTQIELTAHALDTAILYSDGLFVRDSLIINGDFYKLNP